MVPELEANWVMWSGSIGRRPIAERVEAAAAAGYQNLSVRSDELRDLRTTGSSLRELGRRAADRGVRIAIVDAVVTWTAHDPAAWTVATIAVAEALEWANDVGADSVVAIVMADGARPTDRLIQDFGALCDRAERFGCDVNLEFAPMSGVRDLATAWEIVQSADRPNGGIVFDTWHFFRGDPDFGTMERIDGERIRQVQISDAMRVPQGTLVDETHRHRRLPGDGELPLEQVIRALASIGGLRSLGPEVFSTDLHALGPEEAAARAADAVDALVRRALGIPVNSAAVPGGAS